MAEHLHVLEDVLLKVENVTSLVAIVQYVLRIIYRLTMRKELHSGNVNGDI